MIPASFVGVVFDVETDELHRIGVEMTAKIGSVKSQTHAPAPPSREFRALFWCSFYAGAVFDVEIR